MSHVDNSSTDSNQINKSSSHYSNPLNSIPQQIDHHQQRSWTPSAHRNSWFLGPHSTDLTWNRNKNQVHPVRDKGSDYLSITIMLMNFRMIFHDQA